LERSDKNQKPLRPITRRQPAATGASKLIADCKLASGFGA